MNLSARRPETAIITPFGMLEYLQSPFRLRNAAQTFQRFIDLVLRSLTFTFAHIDDILIYSDNEKYHVEHLHQLFSRLENYGMIVSSAKCTFGVEGLDFLGHREDSHGIWQPAQ